MKKNEELLRNKGHSLITVSINQYKQFNDYLNNNHKECMMVQSRYGNSGAINGEYSLIFKIKTINNIFLTEIYCKCNFCGEEIKIDDNPEIPDNTDLEALKTKYNTFINYELIFTDSEKEKLNNLFVNNDGNIEVVFTPNGLNNSIEVNGEEISNNSSW